MNDNQLNTLWLQACQQHKQDAIEYAEIHCIYNTLNTIPKEPKYPIDKHSILISIKKLFHRK